MSTVVTSSHPFRRWCGRVVILYLLVLIAITLWFRINADIDWPATLVLFGPRWLAAAPLLLFIPLVLFLRSWRGLLAGVLSAVIIAWPLMGLVVSLPSPDDSRVNLRLASFNAHNKAADREQFKAWLVKTSPNVLCLQDAGRITEGDLPSEYRLVSAANGLKVAAKHPIALVEEFSHESLGRARGAARFRVSLPDGAREIVNLHLPTLRDGLEAILARRPDGAETMSALIAQREQASAAVRAWIGNTTIIAGDFNMPVESRIYRRDWAGFSNAFGKAGLGWGWTFYSRYGAVRIDHILFQGFNCWEAQVGPHLGSPHRPVTADLAP